MQKKVKLTIVMLVFVIWFLHGLDIEYYTHVNEYNEAFDNNLKLSVFSIIGIISLLLFGETENINTSIQNN